MKVDATAQGEGGRQKGITAKTAGVQKSFWYRENLLDSKIPYPLTNDYLVKVVLQRREVVLRSILCAVLQLRDDEIQSVKIDNPIVPGERVDEKEFILDINTRLNNNIYVDIEMQVINYHNWPERSLHYLCRSFGNLKKGANYKVTGTAVHIGILGFILFKDADDYFSSYRMMDTKTHRIYTDKFQLYTLCLPRLGRATEEDRTYGRELWGRFFKARTWKELYDMATVNPVIEEAAEEIYKCVHDRNIRRRIEMRQDYDRLQRMNKKQLADKDRQLAETKAENEKLAETVTDQGRQLAETKAENEKLAVTVTDQGRQLAETKAEKDKLAETVADQGRQLAITIAENDKLAETVSEQGAEIAELKRLLAAVFSGHSPT